MSSKSIKNKLFLLLALMGAIPFVATIIFIGWQNVMDLEQRAREDNWSRNVTINEHLTQLEDKNLYVLRTLASTPVVKRYLQNPNPEDEATIRKILDNVNNIFQDNNLTAVTDASGQQRIRTDNNTKINMSSRKHFHEVMAGHDYISDIMVSMSNGQLVVVIATPVLDDQNRPIGLVHRNFYLNKVHKFIHDQNTNGSTLILMDRDNHVIASTDEDGAYADGTDLSEEISQLASKLDNGRGVVRLDLKGEDCIAAYSRDKFTGWGILTITPYSVISAAVSNVLARGIILGLIIMIFVNVVAYMLANRISRPLREINKMAANIVNGKTNNEMLTEISNDELGDISQALTEIQSIHESLRNEGKRDELTGLYNRISMEEFCRRKLREYDEPEALGLIAIYLIDLDNFHEVNEGKGQAYGDRLLHEFAIRLKGGFRSNDCVGRLEADKFIVILDRQPHMEIIVNKAKLITEITRNFTLDGENIGLTASVGVAVAPHNGKTYNHLFHAAGLALRSVKEHGRDGYKLADDLET